jgi:hypothetical protein
VQEGGEDVQGDDKAACIPHAVSFLFFVDRAVCTLHAALFSLVLSPPQVPPPPMLTRRHASHTPSHFLSFFHRQGSVHIARRLVFIYSFCLEVLLLGDQQGGVHPTRCLVIFLYFIDGGGTRPHSGSFPPLLGGFFIFPQLYCQRGRCMTHPSPFIYPR